MGIALDERGKSSAWLILNLNLLKSFENLFPRDTQLQFSQAIAHAVMDAEAK